MGGPRIAKLISIKLISLDIQTINLWTMDFAVNQRRSYDGNLCTIRYVGQVEGTSGDWLGVEWDNPTRGKHSGEHNGVRYFTCILPILVSGVRIC